MEQGLNKELQKLLDQHDCPNCPTKDKCLLRCMIEYARTYESELTSVFCFYSERLHLFIKAHVLALLETGRRRMSFQEFTNECFDSIVTAFMSGYVAGLQAPKRGGE